MIVFKMFTHKKATRRWLFIEVSINAYLTTRRETELFPALSYTLRK